MHLQSIVNTGEYLEIAYVEDADVNIDAGVMTSHVVRLAHEALDQEYMDELLTLAKQILDVARRRRHGVADEFKASAR